MPLLSRVRNEHDAGARTRVHRAGQGPLRVHQPAPLECAPERRIRGGGRYVRGPATAVLADARLAVPPPGPVARARLTPGVSPGAGGLGSSRPHPAGRLRRVRGRRRGGPGRRRAGAALGRDEYPYVLYRGRPARGSGAGHGLPGRAGFHLPEQDGARGTLMGGGRPSFIYRLSMRLAQRALPLAARFGKKLARGLDARRGATDRLRARGGAGPGTGAPERMGPISGEAGRRLEQRGARPSAIEVTGDTRYDSVAERAERFDRTRDPFARLAIAPANTFTIVAGSTWPADEAVILPAFVDLLAQGPTARLVLAPHEPNPDHPAGIAQAAAP